jgi:hypothetical protein
MGSSSRPELSQRAKRVLNGYINLTVDERQQLRARLDEVDKGTISETRVINEELQKGLRATLGPTAPGCACCGR